MGLNYLKSTEPLRGDSLLFTTKIGIESLLEQFLEELWSDMKNFWHWFLFLEKRLGLVEP